MLRLLAIGIMAAALVGWPRSASAQQTYRTRTVRLILPFGAASATDITTRRIGEDHRAWQATLSSAAAKSGR